MIYVGCISLHYVPIVFGKCKMLQFPRYWQKRNVNNQAAKRSREARRLKENQIAMRARFLEEENNALKLEVEELKKENGDLRQMMQTLEEKIDKVAASRQ